MDYFGTLRTEALQLAKLEAQGVPGNTERILFQDAGPGVVESIWMAIGGPATATLDGRLRIYNGSDLNIDVDLGTLLCTHWGANGVFGNEHISVDYNGNLGFLINFPIPFGPSGIRVAYYNINNAEPALIYSMVSYRHLGVDLGKRLKYKGRRYADQKLTRNAGDVTTLADITGKPGTLVYHSYVGGDSAQNDSWMERNIACTIDGVRTIESSGTEDWFDSAWYFNQRKNYRVSPHSFVGTDKPSFNEHVVGMATDLWTKVGGIPWQTSCKVEALTESAVVTGDTCCWCILYYQDL